MTESAANYLHTTPPGIAVAAPRACALAAALLAQHPDLIEATRRRRLAAIDGQTTESLAWFLQPEAPGLASDPGAPTRGGAPRPADGDDLTPAERAGLARLTAGVCYELAGEGFASQDLEWITVAALFQLARLIRQGQPITVPSLGTFARQLIPASDHGRSQWIIDYQPEPMLLEDGL